MRQRGMGNLPVTVERFSVGDQLEVQPRMERALSPAEFRRLAVALLGSEARAAAALAGDEAPDPWSRWAR